MDWRPFPLQPAPGQSLANLGGGSRGFRPSGNVEDRRRRGAGDYEQRHRIRTAIAEGQYQNGVDPQAPYTREDVGRWLDKNSLDDVHFVEQIIAAQDAPFMAGFYQDVRPVPEISQELYPAQSLAALGRRF